MFNIEFIENIILTIVVVGLGGLALWTWQRKYWEYQLKRQREDWILRQCYSRKESRKTAMEELLVEMNNALEEFVNATTRAASAMFRRTARNESIQHFNDSELEWLIKSRVISGKIRLHFNGQSAKFERVWLEIIKETEGYCSLLNKPDLTIEEVYSEIDRLRKKKNELLQDMQKEIDRFIYEKLELPIINY